jgi:SAM-dependent methyltransferase
MEFDANKAYFNQAAATRIHYRKRRSYYWDSITDYCNFFIDDQSSILEIGCGTGELLNRFPSQDKTGIDFSERMIEEARKQFPSIRFICSPAENIQTDRKFDVVVLSNIIGYLMDIQAVLEEVRKVCHHETKIMITTYNYLWEPLIKFAEWIRIKKKGPKQSWISKKDLSNLLFLSGFETYRQTSSLIFPLYIPVISGILNRFISRLPLFNFFALNQYTFAKPLVLMNEKELSINYSTSVIIPARNESGNIETILQRIPDFGSHIEIIFIEGHSVDNTWEVISRTKERFRNSHDIKILRQPGKGKADAIAAGLKVAKGDIIILLDADLTTPPEQLPRFYDALVRNKGGFINGSRLLYPVDNRSMRFINQLGNRLFGQAFSWLFEQPIKDTLCGTKAMYRKDYEKLAEYRTCWGHLDPFGDYELLFGAFKLNLKIIDMPVRYQERTYGVSNISRFKHGFLLFRMWWIALFKIKFI